MPGARLLSVDALHAAIMVITFTFIGGCGGGVDDAPETAPVSGKVTLNGKPLTDAKVYFVHSTKTSVGRTDSEGKYSLPEGAIPGENSVYITKIQGEGSVDDGMDAGQMLALDPAGATGEAPAKIKDEVPEKYSNPNNSELSFNVPKDGSDQANFELE